MTDNLTEAEKAFGLKHGIPAYELVKMKRRYHADRDSFLREYPLNLKEAFLGERTCQIDGKDES